MAYEVVIGLEVHAQLLTQSKMFCACGTRFGLPANTQTCPVCLSLPGSLPVINGTAVEMAIRTGLALNCTVQSNRFARKHYFYPDLPKGYQISQYETPICEKGWIEVKTGHATKRIRINRAHLEEDAEVEAKSGLDRAACGRISVSIWDEIFALAWSKSLCWLTGLVARQPTSFGAKLDFCLCGSRGSLGFAESAGTRDPFSVSDPSPPWICRKGCRQDQSRDPRRRWLRAPWARHRGRLR